jgi:ABC-type lipoprotein release transport system permease subunit
MKNFKLAWRNLWRNRRRTMITAGSIFLAVFFALVMRSVQLGTYGHLFGNIIESYSGYIQVQHEDYFDDPIIDNIFKSNPNLENRIIEDENVKGVIPRFESYALASSGSRSKGVLVLGIDTEKEAKLSNIESKLVKYILSEEAIIAMEKEDLPDELLANIKLFKGKEYSNNGRLALELGIEDQDMDTYIPIITLHASVKNDYIKKGEQGALLGAGLASYLGISKGDTIVLLSQGYHGATAAGKYVIKGIISLSAPEIESRIVYLPLDVCQTLFAAEGMLTSMALEIKKTSDTDITKTIKRLENSMEESLQDQQAGFRVLGWRELNKVIVQQMEADNAGGMIMIIILYLVIAFGVFGTVLMMTSERRREFAVVVAIGMQKVKLAWVMVYEMIYIGLIGIIVGAMAATPLILYLYHNPIKLSGEMAKMMEDYGFDMLFKAQMIDSYYLWQSLVVGIIVMVSVIYPVRQILRLKEIEGLRS